MATVNEIQPNILTLEFRQDKSDPQYGTCLWARFYFNTDRYELSILSDCGDYAYKWVETPDSESFLELMARCDSGYLLDKFTGGPKIFDFEKTKERLFNEYIDSQNEEESEQLKNIFNDFDYEPETAEGFYQMFTENDTYNTFPEFHEYITNSYPRGAERICEIFEEHIQPAIQEHLLETKEDDGLGMDD